MVGVSRSRYKELDHNNCWYSGSSWTSTNRSWFTYGICYKIVGGVKSFIGVWQGLAGLFGISGGWFALAVIAIGALVTGLIWAYK